MAQTDIGEERLRAVHAYARAIASRDGLMARRAEVNADDVAQDVVLQYHLLAVPPDNWKGWTARATSNRLVDLARKHTPVLAADLEDRVGRAMGPSAVVIARRQVAEALAVLTEHERAVFGAHLEGASNADVAELYGYASPAVVATVVHRIGVKVRAHFPGLQLDLEPQRPY